MQISLLTRRPGVFNFDYLKEIIKILLNKKSGPLSVLESMKRGLSVIDVEYSVNDKIFEIVHVVSGVNALRYALDLKKKNLIKTLIVGPAIVASPEEEGGIINDPNIDVIVFPSQWTKNYFCSKYPELKEKIKLWPAGVMDPGENSQDKEGVLIFNKNNDKLTGEISGHLNNKIKYSIIKYGKFRQEYYYKLLDTHKYLIYLSDSESQGLAMQEAWMRNTPTLVYNRGYWESGSNKWTDEKISAPYLNDETGMFFKDIEDFKNKFDIFVSQRYNPRKYCLDNLSDIKSAEILINIINKYVK